MNPYRMLGRFDYAINFLMTKYRLALAEEVSDWNALLLGLASNVDGMDRDFCLRMAEASNRYTNETRYSSLSDAEATQERQLGNKEASFIFREYPGDYPEKILSEYDFSDDIAMEERQKTRERRRNIVVAFAIICLIVIGIIIYNLPYFSEQRAYTHVGEVYDSGTKEMLDSAVAEYAVKYPQGKHFSEVMYMPVRFVKDSQNIVQTLEAVDNYIHADPNGQYVKECEAVSDSIWDMEIDRYKSLALSAASRDGADFVMDMLRYMKGNRVRTVQVVSEPKMKVKDYDQYSMEIKGMLEAYYKDSESARAHHIKVPDDLVTITDKISEADIADWTKYVISSLQDGFDKVLTPGLINFKEVKEANRLSASFPRVKVSFSLSNEEVNANGYNIPIIWEPLSSNYSYGFGAKYVLGIEIHYNALFSLPEENKDYLVSGTGNPGENSISGDNPETVYETMCKRSMVQFAYKIANEFGLEPQNTDASK